MDTDCKDNIKTKVNLVDCKDNNKCKDTKKLSKDKENSSELKKLQFYGAGPKMAGFNTKETKKSNKTRGLKLVYEFDPVSKIFLKYF